LEGTEIFAISDKGKRVYVELQPGECLYFVPNSWTIPFYNTFGSTFGITFLPSYIRVIHYTLEGKPRTDYSVNGEKGQLDITQNEKHIHLGGRRNDWTLRFNNTVPLDLKLELGAGQSDLNLNGLNVTHVEINIGVGQMNLDLTGDRKEDLQVDVQGGVGSARIKLPKNVGVRVNASGGIGSVNAHGMRREGDAYVNEVYGKTHATVEVTVQGGVGEISLVEE